MPILTKLRSISIYNWMIAVLALLTIGGFYSLHAAGFSQAAALAQVAAAVVAGAAIDALIIRLKEKKWQLSKSAIITGFFIGTIFAPLPNLLVPIAGVAIAIIQKHIIRFNNRPIFNPASFGLVIAGLLFAADHAWWAAAFLPAVVVLGLFIVIIFGRLHMVASYLLTYWVLLGLSSVLSGSASLPLLDGTMLFFTFLMLVEPKTSPASKKGRIAYGAAAGILGAVFLAFNIPYSIPLNLLVANLLFCRRSIFISPASRE